MLTDELRQKIDRLTKDELRYEINLGPKSRFNEESLAYVKTRLQNLEEFEDLTERKEDTAERRRASKISTFFAVLSLIFAVSTMVGGGGWYQQYQAHQDAIKKENERRVADFLKPMLTYLDDNKAIYDQLQQPRYKETGWGILESYLIKIRRDGVDKHALMKGRIDSLVENNSAVIALLRQYEGYTRSPDLSRTAKAFRNHAIRYRDRWRSLLQVYESQAEFPTAAPSFPKEFPRAIKDEINSYEGDTP